MKHYYNIENKFFVNIINFEYTPKENEFEVDNDTYNEYQQKIKQHYIPNVTVSNGKVSITYKLDEAKQKEAELKKLRAKREPLLRAFDVYKSNVYYGIEKETEEEHNHIAFWYQQLLDLKQDAFDSVPYKINHYVKRV